MYISNNPNNELEQSIVQVPDLVQIPEEIHEMAQEISGGHDDVYLCNQGSKDKAGSFNDELSVKNRRNPIEVIKSRVKKAEKHCGKVKKAWTSAYT